MALHFELEKIFIMKEALFFKTNTNIPFLFKNNNQGSIVLAHNSVFNAWTKHIDI